MTQEALYVSVCSVPDSRSKKNVAKSPLPFSAAAPCSTPPGSPIGHIQSRLALDRWVLPLDPYIFFLYHGWNDPQVQEDGYGDDGKCAGCSAMRLPYSPRSSLLRRRRPAMVEYQPGIPYHMGTACTGHCDGEPAIADQTRKRKGVEFFVACQESA